MKKMLFVTLIAAALSAPAVHADQSVYAGLAVGAGNGELTLKDSTGTLVSKSSATPVNGYAGFAFNPNLAVEGGVTYSGRYTFNGAPTALFGIFHAAVKGSINLTDKWLLTGKVGVARHKLTVDVPDGSRTATFVFKSTSPLLGVGMEYRFTDRYSATLELNDYGSLSTPEAHLKSRNLEAGIKYRF